MVNYALTFPPMTQRLPIVDEAAPLLSVNSLLSEPSSCADTGKSSTAPYCSTTGRPQSASLRFPSAASSSCSALIHRLQEDHNHQACDFPIFNFLIALLSGGSSAPPGSGEATQAAAQATQSSSNSKAQTRAGFFVRYS